MQIQSRCPLCDSILRPERCGVRFSQLKSRIIDLVTKAGPTGIPAQDLFDIAFKGRVGNFGGALSPLTLKVHISQINEMLLGTDWRIRSRNNAYVLIHSKCHKDRHL